MKDAAELFLNYLNGNATEAASLFAADGYVEVPFTRSIGQQPKYCGPTEINNFMIFLHNELYPNFTFKDIQIHIADSTQAFATYVIEARSAISGKMLREELFGHLVAADGKIKSLREAVDNLVAAEAIFPGGLEDVLAQRRQVAATAQP